MAEKEKKQKENPIKNIAKAMATIRKNDTFGVVLPKVEKWLATISKEERRQMFLNLSEADSDDVVEMFKVIAEKENFPEQREAMIYYGLLEDFKEENK